MGSIPRLCRLGTPAVALCGISASVPTVGRPAPAFAVMHIPAVRTINGPYKDVRSIPTNYVIDRAGRVRYAAAGALGRDTLNELLVPLLNEPAPADLAAR